MSTTLSITLLAFFFLLLMCHVIKDKREDNKRTPWALLRVKEGRYWIGAIVRLLKEKKVTYVSFEEEHAKPYSINLHGDIVGVSLCDDGSDSLVFHSLDVELCTKKTIMNGSERGEDYRSVFYCIYGKTADGNNDPAPKEWLEHDEQEDAPKADNIRKGNALADVLTTRNVPPSKTIEAEYLYSNNCVVVKVPYKYLGAIKDKKLIRQAHFFLFPESGFFKAFYHTKKSCRRSSGRLNTDLADVKEDKMPDYFRRTLHVCAETGWYPSEFLFVYLGDTV